MQTDLLTTTLDLLGVFANGLLGGAVARTQNMDMFGFAAMGLVSGLGGGIIRDVLLEHNPGGPGRPRLDPDGPGRGRNRLPDAHPEQGLEPGVPPGGRRGDIALGDGGALKTLKAGLEWLPAVLLGTITAIGGGVSRDLMLQRVPAVFKDGQLYATVAIVVAVIQVVFVEAGACATTPAPRSPSSSECCSGSSPTGAAGGCPWALTGSRTRSCSASRSLGRPITRRVPDAGQLPHP